MHWSPWGMPGSGTVFTNQNWSFPKPVYINDTIHAEASAKSVHRRLSIAEMESHVVNQNGREVLTGEATVYQAT